MPIPIQNFSGSEPDVETCSTEYIVHDFYRCLSNNSSCKYAIPAGRASTYCLHPDQRAFRDVAHPRPASSGTRRDARKAAPPS